MTVQDWIARVLIATAFVLVGLTATAAAQPAWLTEINMYRAATGLAPVSDEPAWDVGIEHHLTYLEKTPHSYFTGQYQSAHTENPASPYYTSDGATEAGYSDLDEGEAHSALEAVDIWLAAPFHAVGMLRAQLTQVALADDPATRYAGLDVIQGLDYALPAATTPILFPGPGVTTDLVSFGGESPDPLETCGWSPDLGRWSAADRAAPAGSGAGANRDAVGARWRRVDRQRSTVRRRRVHLSLIRPDLRSDRRRDSPGRQRRVPDSPPPAGDRDVLGQRVADRSARHRLVVLRGRSRDPYDDPRGSRARAHG